ncbi:hypothetical protein, partial [Jeotgalibaca porci]|uniref:hypothetical protein n=1 Tax=Jeotgalibaca porci TaxID=1868793 RepID=UPI0035A168F6
ANQKVERVYVYSHLKNDQDTADNTYQTLHARSTAIPVTICISTLYQNTKTNSSGMHHLQ